MPKDLHLVRVSFQGVRTGATSLSTMPQPYGDISPGMFKDASPRSVKPPMPRGDAESSQEYREQGFQGSNSTTRAATDEDGQNQDSQADTIL